MYSGTIGSGKSYHALEDILEKLNKGYHVIANFPLEFTAGQIKKGLADRYMYVPDQFLMGKSGISLLLKISKEMGWLDDEKEGLCTVVIDEATNYFPKEDASHPIQKLWRKFFTQSRKLGYDFILIVQDDTSLNKTINKCIEYDVKHRKANNIFPFKILNIIKRKGFPLITIFVHVTYWKQQRQRLGSGSTIYVHALGKMYQSKRLFANLEEELDIDDDSDNLVIPVFGNCVEQHGEVRRGPSGEVPDGAELFEEEVEHATNESYGS